MFADTWSAGHAADADRRCKWSGDARLKLIPAGHSTYHLALTFFPPDIRTAFITESPPACKLNKSLSPDKRLMSRTGGLRRRQWG